MEQVKIIVDKEGHTHLWINGQKIKYITKIKFEVNKDTADIPTLEIKKDFLPIQTIEMDGKKIEKF